MERGAECARGTGSGSGILRMTALNPALVAAIQQTAPAPDSDKLEQCRDLIREARDVQSAAQDLEERRAKLMVRFEEIRQKELVDLFQELSIRSMELDAEGNNPAVNVKLKPFYRANIAADWSPEKRDAAFSVLETAGGGDLIKRVFTIQFGKGPEDKAIADKLRKALTDGGFKFTEGLSVSWQTLTAWLKEQVEGRQVIPPLEAIGGVVGTVVELKTKG